MGCKPPAAAAGRGLLGGAAWREQGFSHLGAPAPSWGLWPILPTVGHNGHSGGGDSRWGRGVFQGSPERLGVLARALDSSSCCGMEGEGSVNLLSVP